MDPVSKAQAGQESPGIRAKNRGYGLDTRFKPGVSGNPSGRPKKLFITKMYENVLDKAQHRKQIEESLLETLKSRGMAKVLLLREMAERTEGKIAQTVEVEGDITLALAETVQQRRKRLGDGDNEP